MNSSLWSADIVTHVKIVTVSLVAAIAVATIAVNARVSEIDSTSVRINADSPIVVKVGKPVNFSTKDSSTVR